MKINTLTMAFGALVIGAAAAHAQAAPTEHKAQHQATYKRNLPDSLTREATVTEAQAIEAAKKALPNGHLASIELEREGGKLIYSMDVKTQGKPGIDEVNVDAKTGQTIGAVQHEDAGAEAAEAKAEAKTGAKTDGKPAASPKKP